jgi:galactokinase
LKVTQFEKMKPELLKEFQRIFHREPEHIFFCPGRVNLIGEHIDYNGGRVLPCAISLGTYLAVSKNTDKKLRFHSLDFPESVELQLQDSYSKTGKSWYNYPLGMINAWSEQGHSLSGLDLVFAGNLPIAAGLSSSASIEVLMGYALNEMFGAKLSRKDLALMGKQAENSFIGVQSGIMDQFAVAHGKEGHALLLDCDTLEFEYVPFSLDEYALVIINTNKARTLADSKYNERFMECGQALKALKTEMNVENLCAIAPDEFLANRHIINDPILEKRALHVVLENDRVKQAVKAMKENDLACFGKLMYASHKSLSELYEVSGEELDTIVEFAQSYDGCIGARMTGAGFGGCAIALVKRNCADDFAEKMNAYYKENIGYAPDVFATSICDGVREITV